MPRIALRVFPSLSVRQRRTDHDHGEKCGLGGLFHAFNYVAADGANMMLILLLVFVPPVVWLPWTWFSILAVRFGRQVGSRLWQATGVIYLIATVMILAGAAMLAFGAAPFPFAGELIFGCPPVLLLGWVCHGISMIVGARMMTRT